MKESECKWNEKDDLCLKMVNNTSLQHHAGLCLHAGVSYAGEVEVESVHLGVSLSLIHSLFHGCVCACACACERVTGKCVYADTSKALDACLFLHNMHHCFQR